MEPVALLWLCGLIAATTYLTLSYETTFAFDQLVQTAIGCLSALAAIFLGLGFFAQRLFNFGPSSRRRARSSLPFIRLNGPLAPTTPNVLAFDDDLNTDLSKPFDRHGFQRFGEAGLKLAFIILIVTGLLRVETARWIVSNSQCAGRTWTPLVPLFFNIVQIYTLPPDPKATTWLDRRRAHFLLPTAIVSFGSFYVFSVLPYLRSTYICSLALHFRLLIPFLQFVSAILDVIILCCLSSIIFRGPEIPPTKASPHSPIVLGVACLVCIPALLVQGFWLYWRTREYGQWLAILTLGLSTLSPAFCTVSAFAAFCSFQCVSRLGTRATLALLMLCITSTQLVHHGMQAGLSLSPISVTQIQAAALVFTIGGLTYLRQESRQTPPASKNTFASTITLPRLFSFALVVLFVSQVMLWQRHRLFSTDSHPIDELIAEAERAHQIWENQALASRNLQEAAVEYRRRYHRNPPPRFDRWYNYTAFQGVKTFDDFDNIFNDLLPFWSVSPAELRARTVEAISNPWNYVGGIIVRKGRPEIAPHVPISHAWMLQGIAQMMHPFAKWLPDMDIAFNLNDESRVAAYFNTNDKATKEGLRRLSKNTDGSQDFSPDRRQTWPEVSIEPSESTPFVDQSFVNSFRTWGVVGCPPDSKARTERRWDKQALCTACKAPHSKQQFLQNWTLAADPCHQPDLQYLHGVYAAPSTIRNTHELYPIFSQSKSHGYNDILFPSPWNYEDKALYEPSKEFPDVAWAEKETTLFWRGGTSEGFSPGNGAWKGIGRQRFVHTLNNATDHEQSLVILPSQPYGANKEAEYTFQLIKPSVLRSHLPADAQFVGKIERCWDLDCTFQRWEFSPESHPPVDFQSHWRYKYLFDIDGAGFSGRFLPFMQSKSLPFKTALMREWWDGRLTPWKHFVPIDVRFAELWSVLAYFAGWKIEDTNEWLLKPHDAEAEKIATEGRNWAQAALSKEDMEAYFFRLLLEWARLTDDNRDELGYAGDLA